MGGLILNDGPGPKIKYLPYSLLAFFKLVEEYFRAFGHFLFYHLPEL